MRLYSGLFKSLKRMLPDKTWLFLGDERVNALIGLIIFFAIFAFVRLIWWGGEGNLAVYTGYNGEYKPKPIFEFLDLEGYNRWISLRTADGVDFFTRTVFGQTTTHKAESIIITEGGKYAGGVKIFPTCAGNREMVIILLVMLLIPGPTKQRLWFIPSAIIAFFLINCFRLAIVAYVTKVNMDAFVVVHDYSGKAMSVFVFFIWLLWEKKYAEKYRLKMWKSVNDSIV